MIVYIATRIVEWLFNMEWSITKHPLGGFIIATSWMELIVEVPALFVALFVLLSKQIGKAKEA